MKFKHRYTNKILVIIMLLIGMYLIVSSFSFLEDDYSAVVNDLEMSNWQLEVEGTDFKEEIQLPYEMNENYDNFKSYFTNEDEFNSWYEIVKDILNNEEFKKKSVFQTS